MDGFAIATALARGVHVAALLSLFGCLVFRQFGAPASETAPRAVATRIAAVSACIAWVVGAAWLVALSATIAGADTAQALAGAVPMVAAHTSFGHVVCARLVLLIAILASLRRRAAWARAAWIRAAALLGAGVAVALQPLIGHLGALPDDARAVLVPVEIAHLLAAGAWFGGLAPLLVSVASAPARLAATLCERFTTIGLVAVGTIAVTAFPQAGELIGGLPGLFGTQYGHLALVKLGLFGLALGLAGVNRLVLTARIAGASLAARRYLIVSISIEAAAVACVILAAAFMASSPPAAHVQPVWPFAWRPSLGAWDEPELRPELWHLLIAVAAGVGLIAASQIARRFRVLARGIAIIVVAPFTPALELLLVEAYPTSYARSTTGFSTDAIVRGASLYGQNCAVCHDAQNGKGTAADLLAPHLWGHLDGELFWWITNGIADFEGNAVMPAYASMLSEDDRWALIDFIRARNVGAQISGTGRWSPPVPAPATPVLCDGSDADTIADLATKVLYVVASDDTASSEAARGSGAMTIRLVRDEAGPPEHGECVTAAASAWPAWAELIGVAPDRLAGYRAIVDGQGWLRAVLPPDVAADRVLAAIRDARDHPIAAGRADAGHHHH